MESIHPQGGYNVDAISQSALACTRVLLGDPPEQLGALKASARATAAVFETAKIHSKYWKNMVPRAPPPKAGQPSFLLPLPTWYCLMTDVRIGNLQSSKSLRTRSTRSRVSVLFLVIFFFFRLTTNPPHVLDLLSAHRKEHLYNAFRLYPLPIAVEKLEAIFRHRICVS